MESFETKLYNKIAGISFIAQRLRIWSRCGIIMYLILLHSMVEWVIGLPSITTPQAVIVSVITGLATPITAFYTNSGKNLYSIYGNITYQNGFSRIVDNCGFVVDKLRIFPLILLIYYCLLLYRVINWGMILEGDLTAQQASFIATFAGSASMVFGFFINAGEVNMKIENIYTERHDININQESKHDRS